MAQDSSRRSFVKTSAVALAAAPGILSAQGANDRLNLGWIGAGSRGNYLEERFYVGKNENAQIGYVCDAYDGNVARAIDRVQSMGGNKPKSTKDYRDVLADPSIDAVVIATPEHLHHNMAIAALEAGKHIYVEKPLSHTIEEGEEVRRGREEIRQGSAGRHAEPEQLALPHGQGHGGPGPDRRHPLRPGVLVPQLAAERPRLALCDPRRRRPAEHRLGSLPRPGAATPVQTRSASTSGGLYWDYSGGISTDLLVHQTDIVNFVCSKSVPLSCMASGGIYRWTGANDDREVPDCLSAIYEYPGKFHINYSCYFGNDHYGYGEQFMGNEGTIEVLEPPVPELLSGGVRRTRNRRTSPPARNSRCTCRTTTTTPSKRTFENWLNAIRGEGTS